MMDGISTDAPLVDDVRPEPPVISPADFAHEIVDGDAAGFHVRAVTDPAEAETALTLRRVRGSRGTAFTLIRLTDAELLALGRVVGAALAVRFPSFGVRQ